MIGWSSQAASVTSSSEASEVTLIYSSQGFRPTVTYLILNVLLAEMFQLFAILEGDVMSPFWLLWPSLSRVTREWTCLSPNTSLWLILKIPLYNNNSQTEEILLHPWKAAIEYSNDLFFRKQISSIIGRDIVPPCLFRCPIFPIQDRFKSWSVWSTHSMQSRLAL